MKVNNDAAWIKQGGLSESFIEELSATNGTAVNQSLMTKRIPSNLVPNLQSKLLNGNYNA